MADYAGCGIEELEKFVMPRLGLTTDDPAMVAVTNKGYAVTRRGLAELDRRGIPHRGKVVVAGGHERLDFGAWDGDFGRGGAVAALPPPRRRRKGLTSVADYYYELGGDYGSSSPMSITPPTVTVPLLPPPDVPVPPPQLRRRPWCRLSREPSPTSVGISSSWRRDEPWTRSQTTS